MSKKHEPSVLTTGGLERKVKSKSAAARAIERRLNEFEAVVRAHETREVHPPSDQRDLERAYEKARRNFINILRSLVNLAEDGEPL